MQFYSDIVQHKSKFLVTGYSQTGEKIREEVKYKPYHFVPSTKPDAPYKTLEGRPLERLDFDDVWDAKEYVKKYKEVEGFEVYGSDKYLYSYIYDTFQGEINFNLDWIRVVPLDIEVDSEGGFPNIDTADKEITAIGYYFRGTYHLHTCLDFDVNDPRLEGAKVKHYKASNEAELLDSFIQKWEEIDPDIITGWYVAGFDMPYLFRRIRRVLGLTQAEKLSP